MNSIDQRLTVLINSGLAIGDLWRGVAYPRCPCPQKGREVQGDPYCIDVLLVPVSGPHQDCESLRSAIFEVLLARRLRALNPFEALCFDREYSHIQQERPYVIMSYAFGRPNFDPFDTSAPNHKWEGSQVSSIDWFCRCGTSRHLLIAAAKPTDVNLGTFDCCVIERDIPRSLASNPQW